MRLGGLAKLESVFNPSHIIYRNHKQIHNLFQITVTQSDRSDNYEKLYNLQIYLFCLILGVGIVSAMEIINEFSGEGIEKLQNLK